MKQKISGHIRSTNVNIICKREAMDGYLTIFSKYFDAVGNCISETILNNMQNTIICYSRVTKLINCGACDNNKCIEVPDKWNLGLGDPMWEHVHNKQKIDFMRVEAADYTRKVCDNSIIITLKTGSYNRVVAEYCPAKKIMLTTDWTHDGARTKIVREFLEYLEKNIGLLAPRKLEKQKPIVTLGADPEMEYVDPDTEQVISCREMGIQDRVLIAGSSVGRIGSDGSGQQRELRPEPATSPEGLIANIEKLINAGLDERWSLRGDRFTLGGHIHIGGVEESRDFGKLLDYYLGPLDVLNSPARKESSYGKPGSGDSVRKQPYGMEYRTPPVGWLASKELARVTLTIVQKAAEKHFYGEDIEITDNLGRDLENLGISENDVKLFFDEISKYKTNGLPTDMKVAWGYKIPPKFTLEFRDGWSRDVRDYIESIVREMASEEQLGGRCVFYGLSGDRGNVFSVVMSHMNGIDMPETYGFMPPIKIGAGINHVGMPANIRSSLKEAKKMADTILEIIRRTINPPVIAKKPKKKTIKARAIPEDMNVAHYFDMR